MMNTPHQTQDTGVPQKLDTVFGQKVCYDHGGRTIPFPRVAQDAAFAD